MEKERGILLLSISIISIIVIIFILIFTVFEFPTYRAPWMSSGRPRMISTSMLPIYILLLVLAILPLSYYFISNRLEEKIEKNMKIIARIVSKKNLASNNKPGKIDNKSIILKFLSPVERMVLEKLTEEEGKTFQADISRMEGMTKLKTHRVIKDLEMKGIVSTESYGKTKRIILSKEIKDALQS